MHSQVTVRIKHRCWCTRSWGLAVLPRALGVFSLALSMGRISSTCLLQPSGSAGYWARAMQPERVFASPATLSAFLSSLLPFSSSGSQAAILSVPDWLRKACNTRTKGTDFCFPGYSVILLGCACKWHYFKRQLCYLAMCWRDFRNQCHLFY